MSKYVATLLVALVLVAPASAAQRNRGQQRDPERIVKVLENIFSRLVALSPGLTEPKP